MTTERLGAVVLCGGQSRRMGHDKASLPFGEETVLERVMRAVGAATTELVLALGPTAAATPGYRVSRDRAPGEGPLPALLDAVALVQTELVFVVACDTPLLQPRLIPLLADLCQGFDGAVPLVRGQRAVTCAVYRRAALLEARTPFGDPRRRSLRAYVSLLRIRDVQPSEITPIDPALLSFVPCNTPEEYLEALRLAGL